MPICTLVIACFEMERQVGRTVTSCLPPYQQGIDDGDLDVVVVDNGSREPLSPTGLPSGVTVQRIPPPEAAPYPGPAINAVVDAAATPAVGIMIDGARLLTPGAVRGALDVLERWPGAVVDVRGWHLGRAAQQDLLAAGEDPMTDQDLLRAIDWPRDGYRLFEVCASTFSTRGAFLGTTNESTAIFTDPATWAAAGGYDERFRTPGGGLANIDLWRRLVDHAQPVVTLLGEGTFHQAHGGASTGLPRPRLAGEFAHWRTEYEQLTGRNEVGAPPYDPLLVGRLGPAATRVQAAALAEDVT